MKSHFILYSKFFMLFLFIGCNSSSKTSGDDIWKNTTKVILDKEDISFRIPNQFKRSSRFRIEKDLNITQDDSTFLVSFQNALHSLEFEDSNVDVFVDTTQMSRFIIICNTEKSPISKSDAAILEREIKLQNETAQAQNDNVMYSDVEGSLKQNDKLTIAKYKTTIFPLTSNQNVYQTHYFISSQAFTLIVYEHSNVPEDISNFLWSVK